MRVVVYDSEDMEPITVIALPERAKEYLAHPGPVREIVFPVNPPMAAVMAKPAEIQNGPARNQCRLRFEPIWQGERVLMWLCTTLDGETALLLRSTFLPGQQRAVSVEREQAFWRGFERALALGAA